MVKEAHPRPRARRTGPDITGAATRGRRRSSEEIRTLVVDAAAAQFAAHDFANVSVKDIADSANVSLSVFYRHFRDKAEVFEAAVLSPLLSFLSTFVPTWQAHRQEPVDDAHNLQLLVEELYRNFSEHRDALRAYIGRSGELGASLTDRLNVAVGALFHEIVLMATVENDQRLYHLSPTEVDQTIRLILSMVMGAVVFESWILTKSDGPGAQQQLTNRMVELLLPGITARRPSIGTSNGSTLPDASTVSTG